MWPCPYCQVRKDEIIRTRDQAGALKCKCRTSESLDDCASDYKETYLDLPEEKRTDRERKVVSQTITKIVDMIML